MTFIPRYVTDQLIQEMEDQNNYTIAVTGLSRSGKSRLLKNIAENDRSGKTIYINGISGHQERLDRLMSGMVEQYFLGNYHLVLIDNIHLIDNFEELIRKWNAIFRKSRLIFVLPVYFLDSLERDLRIHRLYPLSFLELCDFYGVKKEKEQLFHRMIYGSFPETVFNRESEEKILEDLFEKTLVNSALWSRKIRKPSKLLRLMKVAAERIGDDLSLLELSNYTGIDNQTIGRYLQLFEKYDLIIYLKPFSQGNKDEITQKFKVYFIDNGIRNTLIWNFMNPALRGDYSKLWINYLISERRKLLNQLNIQADCFFWKTAHNQGVDYIELRAGKIFAYQFDRMNSRKRKFPENFIKFYSGANLIDIKKDHYEAFLSEL